MWPYAATIFLSAFLLFQVQPLIAKHILPWFGGAAAVWTTCMLFFQVLLLAGYAYAHWLAGRSAFAVQRRVHLVLLGASAALLLTLAARWGIPLLPDAGWKPPDEGRPILRILVLLALGVGLPFFMLATTNPLLQAWFSRMHPRVSPYRLYALSNLGSLLGLVSYPFLVEFLLPLRIQSVLWTAGYLVFAAGIAYIAAGLDVRRAAVLQKQDSAAARPRVASYLLWFGLAACASAVFLAVTNHLTQDLAAVPFLWMLPLSLYLLSFVLCFESERWYSRRLYAPAFLAALALSTLLLQHEPESLLAQGIILVFTLFVTCMVCHGELARLKPPARYLTSFYLSVTGGGAAGGAFVALVAPYLFRGFWELPIGLWAAAALLFAVLLHDRRAFVHRGGAAPAYATLSAAALLAAFVFAEQFPVRSLVASAAGTWPYVGLATAAAALALLMRRKEILAATWPKRGQTGPAAAPKTQGRRLSLPSWGVSPTARKTVALAAALALLAVAHLAIALAPMQGTLSVVRNFYGVLFVIDEQALDPDARQYLLKHGRIVHGSQYHAAHRRREPTAYYTLGSGIGLVIAYHPARAHGLRLGVIGLGTGTLAAYGREGDYLRFYEINPEVIRLASGRGSPFSYLRDTPAVVDIVPGDARVALERELVRGARQRFDILAIDAFSGDAIPVHLLTKEAMAVYLEHLDADDGLLALHISNRYVDLRPVVQRLAHHYGLAMAVLDTEPEDGLRSLWALIARNAELLRHPAIAAATSRTPIPHGPLWTDDFSNLLRVLRVLPEAVALSAQDGIGCRDPHCSEILDMSRALDWSRGD